MKKYFVLLLFLIFCCATVNCRLIDYSNRISKDLFDNNAISALTKDSKGFLWVATSSALVRFDGYSYLKVEREGLDTLFNGRAAIYQLAFFSPETLWVCSSVGLFSYNIRTHHFEQQTELGRVRVNSIKRGNDAFYLNTSRGIVRYYPESKKIDRLFSLDKQSLVSAAEDMHGRYWVSTNRFLLRLPSLSCMEEAFDRGEAIPVDTIRRFSTNHRILIDSLNVMWMWDKESLTTARVSAKGQLEDMQSKSAEITAICLLSDNNVVLCRRGQGNEILYRDESGRTVDTEKVFATFQYDDLANTTNVFYVDELEDIWIGTRNGLFMLPFGRRSNMHTITNDINNPVTLSHNTVSSIFVDKNNTIWIGTAYGLNRLQHKGDEIEVRQLIDNRASINHAQENKIEQIVIDSKGIMWLGTKKNIKFYNPATNVFFSKPDVESALEGNSFVRALYRDHSDNIWIGYQTGGLFVFDERKKQLERISSRIAGWDNCTAIQEDSRNTIWASSKTNGILKIVFNGERQEYETKLYRILRQNQTAVSVNCLYIDKYNNIWVGTDVGLYKFSEEKDSFIAMTLNEADDGNAQIVGIISDNRGNLWIASTKGIYKYNISELRSYFFSLYDGVLTRPGFVFSCNIDQNGIIYMSGVNGLTYFDPDEIMPDQTHYPVRFVDFKANNKSLDVGSAYLKDDLNFTDKVVLDHHTNQFSFSFLALTYNREDSNLKYAYKLDGVDKDWISIESSVPVISYNNLSPGTYVLNIRSTNLNGKWLDNTESLIVEIKPAFYQTWYFYTFLFICLLIVGWFVFRIWKAQIDIHIQKKTAQHKLDLYADIAYCIKTPLNLLKTPLNNLTRHYNAMSEEEIKYMFAVMLRNSNRLSLLIDQLIEFKQKSETVPALEAVKGDFIALAKTVCNGFSDLYAKKGVEISFSANVEKFAAVFDPQKMETVIFNLLFNVYGTALSGDRLAFKCMADGSQQTLTAVLEIQKARQGEKQDKNSNHFMDVGTLLADELLRLHESKLVVDDKRNTISFLISAGKPLLETQTEAVGDVEQQSLSEFYADYMEQQSLDDFAEGEYLPHAPLVYLADADKEMTNFIRKVCAPSLKVIPFLSAEELYNEVLQVKPKLIISEVVFDGEKQGLRLCRKIKENDALSDIPFLFLTTYTSDADKEMGYEANCDAYVFKPFDISLLKKRILTLVENQENVRKKIKREFITNPQEIEMQSSDEIFLAKCMGIIEKNMENENFNVETFAEAVHLSTSMLYRRVKDITNLGPNDLIKSVRLKRAAQLLATDALRISEVAERVGFLDVRYFSTCFKKEFGVTPSQYQKKGKE